METCCDYLGHDIMYVSTDEAKFKNKLLKYNKEYPGLVTIIKMPEENQGTLYCTCPPAWLRIQPPCRYTEEQRAAASERMRKYHQEHIGEK